MPLLREIQVRLGIHEPPTPMQRAQESVSRNPTIDRLKTQLGLQQKTELQEFQDNLCPKLSYEQVRARGARLRALALASGPRARTRARDA